MKSLIEKLNAPWHKRALQIFMLIVLAHWAEHLVQAYQVYVLRWPMHEARGVLGQAFPWLVHSEVLHYSYAVIMLAGIWAFLPGFVGRARSWWLAALVIQYTIVFVPMIIGMYYHVFPSAPDAAHMHCTCSLRLHPATT